MKELLTLGCCAATLMLASASGATIQYNYGPVFVNFLSGNDTNAPVQGFDPTLGTLAEADLAYSATATLVQGNAISSRIDVDDGATLLGQIGFPHMTGRAQQLESGIFVVPTGNLADFETAGTLNLTFVRFTACRGAADTPTGCSAFSANVGGTITYTYTPAVTQTAAAPEPASFFALGVGLIGIGLVRRKWDRPPACPREEGAPNGVKI
jgi:hypothetical protein